MAKTYIASPSYPVHEGVPDKDSPRGRADSKFRAGVGRRGLVAVFTTAKREPMAHTAALTADKDETGVAGSTGSACLIGRLTAAIGNC